MERKERERKGSSTENFLLLLGGVFKKTEEQNLSWTNQSCRPAFMDTVYSDSALTVSETVKQGHTTAHLNAKSTAA